MSCLPNTPVMDNILSATNSVDMGWIELASPTTAAVQRYYPLSTSFLFFNNLAQTTNQHVILRQIEIEETASSSAIIKTAPLKLLLFDDQSPAAPTLGAVYNPTNSYVAGIYDIPAANYSRFSDTVWKAVINPNHLFRTATSSNVANFVGVLLSNDPNALTYAAGVGLRVRIFTEMASAI